MQITTQKIACLYFNKPCLKTLKRDYVRIEEIKIKQKKDPKV